MVSRAMEDNPDLAESMENMHPIGRVGQPPEIADVVVFLCSDGASFMTGEAIDGALILQNTDLFYFAGTIQQAHLYVPAQGRPLLMVRKNYQRARAESAISAIVPLSSPKQLMGLIGEHGLTPPIVVGMELDVLPVNFYRHLADGALKGAMFPDGKVMVTFPFCGGASGSASVVGSAGAGPTEAAGHTPRQNPRPHARDRIPGHTPRDRIPGHGNPGPRPLCRAP